MTTIKEDYVSFEVAKLLKEKGFDEGCRAHYGTAGSFSYEKYEVEASGCKMHNAILAPTLQMTMKWLREVHNIYMDIAPTHSINEPISFIWQTYNADYLITGDCDTFYSTYEEAVEAAIKFCLENLI